MYMYMYLYLYMYHMFASGETRELMHYWYNTWPDHGIPKKQGKPYPDDILGMYVAVLLNVGGTSCNSLICHLP